MPLNKPDTFEACSRWIAVPPWLRDHLLLGHIPSWRGSASVYAVLPVAAGGRYPLLLPSRLLSSALSRLTAGVASAVTDSALYLHRAEV